MSFDTDAGMDLVLRRAVAGDSHAFAEIVRKHQAMVFSLGWHFLADRALAEDVAQEVFLQLYRNLSTFESASHLVHWLRRVTVHRCVDQSRKKHFRRELPLAETHEMGATTALADSFLSERLRQSVALLPAKQRMVVILRYQEEMGLAEIAGAMQIPLNTVKSTLYRALQDLRGKLTRERKEARHAFL